MTKRSGPRRMRDKTNRLSKKQLAAAARIYSAQAIDNSPQIDSAMLADVMEDVSALNLINLSKEMSSLPGTLPLLQKLESKHKGSYYPMGEEMAVAFETGRRYMLLQILQLLHEEVEVLPNKPVKSHTGPILEA